MRWTWFHLQHPALMFSFLHKISTKPQSQPKTANATKGGGKGKGPMKSTPSADNKDLKNMLKNLRQNEVVSNKPNKPNNYAIALHTAQVIADNGSHPRQKDVRCRLNLKLHLTGFILFRSSSLLSSTNTTQKKFFFAEKIHMCHAVDNLMTMYFSCFDIFRFMTY